LVTAVTVTRIYYTDAYCQAFDARVVRAFVHDGRPAVTLDRTAFYPTSGGQPFDVGALGDAAVVDVVDVEGDVVHVLSSPLTEGAAVRGQIDWTRRFDHMQQHTGQHVLSAALVRVCNAATVSFHLGSDASTIDLSAAVGPDDVERAVDEANRIVWANHEVAIRFASEEEAKALPLRKESARQGELRLVEVPDFDLSACGGTHVARTGAIGVIAVTGTEKFKGGVRLTFVCGARALRALRQLRDAVAGSVRVLSVLPQELPAAVEKLQADGKRLRKTMAGLQASLAVHEADRLLAGSRNVAAGLSGLQQGDRRVIAEIYEGGPDRPAATDWDAAGLKTIASSLIARDPVAVVLVAGGPSATVVVACAPSLGLDANAVVRRLTERFGGRGGGRPDMAQAGGLSGHTAEIASVARQYVEADL
jgi:alanyl-tRNA synthetase